MNQYQISPTYDNPCRLICADCVSGAGRSVVLRALVFSLILLSSCGCAAASSSRAQEASAAVVPPDAVKQSSEHTVSVQSGLEQPLMDHSGTAQVLEKGVDEGWHALVDRLEADGFERPYVESLFQRVENPYSAGPMGHKIRALFKTKYTPRKPAAKKSVTAQTPSVYPGVLVPENMRKARTFLQDHRTSLRLMEKRFGVPKEVAVGLMLVETRLGNFLGKEQAFRNLACLAASDSLDRIRPQLDGLKITQERAQWLSKRIDDKSSWAYAELKALITYSQRSGLDPVSMPGSIYGAVGICQFMPSNIIRFGVDGDGDGKVNLFHAQDAMHSLANYLKYHGWKPGLSRAKQTKVLRHYNNSSTYANTILAVADALR